MGGNQSSKTEANKSDKHNNHKTNEKESKESVKKFQKQVEIEDYQKTPFILTQQSLKEVQKVCILLNDSFLFKLESKSFDEYRQIPELSIVIDLIESLNPHLKIISKQGVDDFVTYQIIKESLEPLPSLLQKRLDDETQQYLQKLEYNSKNIRLEKLNKEQQTKIGMALLYTKLSSDGHSVFISNKQIESSESFSAKQQIIFTNQQDMNSYLQIKFSKIEFKDFLEDKPQRDNLITSLVKIFNQHFQLDPETEQILVLDASEGCTKLVFQIPVSINVTKSKVISPEVIENLLMDHHVKYCSKENCGEQSCNESSDQSSSQENCDTCWYKKVNHYFIKWFSSATNLIIHKSSFSPKYNMFWDESHHKITHYRGSIKHHVEGLKPFRYYFPVNYTGIALNVSEQIQNDQSGWFGANRNPESWIVLFHGTKSKGIKGILQDMELKPGSRDAYKGKPCIITGEIIKPNNVYFGQTVEICEEYSEDIKLNGLAYKFIFQCRVDPSVVRCIISRNKETYYLVNYDQTKQIRPYRFLIQQK